MVGRKGLKGEEWGKEKREKKAGVGGTGWKKTFSRGYDIGKGKKASAGERWYGTLSMVIRKEE